LNDVHDYFKHIYVEPRPSDPNMTLATLPAFAAERPCRVYRLSIDICCPRSAANKPLPLSIDGLVGWLE